MPHNQHPHDHVHRNYDLPAGSQSQGLCALAAQYIFYQNDSHTDQVPIRPVLSAIRVYCRVHRMVYSHVEMAVVHLLFFFDVLASAASVLVSSLRLFYSSSFSDQASFLL